MLHIHLEISMASQLCKPPPVNQHRVCVYGVQGAPRTRSTVLGCLEALKATQCGSLFSKNLHSVQHVPCVVGERSSEQSLGSLGSGSKNIWMQECCGGRSNQERLQGGGELDPGMVGGWGLCSGLWRRAVGCGYPDFSEGQKQVECIRRLMSHTAEWEVCKESRAGQRAELIWAMDV